MPARGTNENRWDEFCESPRTGRTLPFSGFGVQEKRKTTPRIAQRQQTAARGGKIQKLIEKLSMLRNLAIQEKMSSAGAKEFSPANRQRRDSHHYSDGSTRTTAGCTPLSFFGNR
jgi:hypothetical protein